MRQNIRTAPVYLTAVMLMASLVATLYAEAGRPAGKFGGNNTGPKIGNQNTKNNTTTNNARRGDNRDDARSGKVDRIGDGNSGQGDDKKSEWSMPKKHDPRTCPICKNHLPPLPPKKQPPKTTENNDNSGVRDRGQGEGRDGIGQGAENRPPKFPRRKWGRREDVRDRREDIRDRREDRRDKAEDKVDRKTDSGKWDKKEDRRDQREDIRDRREDVRDRREDKRDKKVFPKRKWVTGDNRDDARSGKVDRIGDGNSGQGNDRQTSQRRERTNRPDIRGGSSGTTTPARRRGDNRDDTRSGRTDRIGDGNSGQGNDKDARIRPPHNPRLCPICNPKLKNDLKNRKIITPKDDLGISPPKDKSNKGVRDGGQGEGRDRAGQGKGQGDTNKENKENPKK